jgi:hypothetical protein
MEWNELVDRCISHLEETLERRGVAEYDESVDEDIQNIIDSTIPTYDYDVIELAMSHMDLVRYSPEFGNGTPIDLIRQNIWEQLESELSGASEALICLKLVKAAEKHYPSMRLFGYHCQMQANSTVLFLLV